MRSIDQIEMIMELSNLSTLRVKEILLTGEGFSAKLHEDSAGEKKEKTKSEEKLFGMS